MDTKWGPPSVGGRAGATVASGPGGGKLALRAVQELPDDATFEAAMGRLYFLEKVAHVACARKLLTILNTMARTGTPWQLDFQHSC